MQRIRRIEPERAQLPCPLLGRCIKPDSGPGQAKQSPHGGASTWVRSLCDLTINGSTAHPGDVTLLHAREDAQHGLSFVPDAVLRLVIVWTVEAANIEVDEQGAFLAAIAFPLSYYRPSVTDSRRARRRYRCGR